MNQTEYFQKIGYRAVYNLGDRVRGKFNGIPFSGSIGNDTLKDTETGPYLTIHPDLPVMYNGKIHNILIVKHSSITDRYVEDRSDPSISKRFPPFRANRT